MSNPYEQASYAKRVTELIKERDELRKLIVEANRELDVLKTVDGFYKDVARVNESLKIENEELKQEVKSAHENGYNQAVWDVTNFLTDKQKEFNK